MKNAIIRLENISKIYGKDDYKTVAFRVNNGVHRYADRR